MSSEEGSEPVLPCTPKVLVEVEYKLVVREGVNPKSHLRGCGCECVRLCVPPLL
jgi:hypothetical protein